MVKSAWRRSEKSTGDVLGLSFLSFFPSERSTLRTLPAASAAHHSWIPRQRGKRSLRDPAKSLSDVGLSCEGGHAFTVPLSRRSRL